MIATRRPTARQHVAYVNLVGRQRRARLRRRRLSSQNGRMLFEAPRFREGVAAVTVDLDRTRRLRTREHDVARRPGRVAPWPPLEWRAWRRRAHRGSRASRSSSRPVEQELLPPAKPAAPPRPRARDFCEELLDALALGVGDYFEKNGCFKTIGVALSGGRDSLLVLAIARRWIDAAPRSPEAERQAKAREILRAFFMPTRFSSPETRAAAEQTARDFDAPFVGRVRSTTPSSASSPRWRRCSSPASRSRAGAPERPGARARRADVDVGQQRRRALPPDEQHEREGRRLRDHRRRHGGRAQRHRQRAEDGRQLPHRLALRETARRGSADLLKPASAELADDMEDERELMPFPVLDACFALFAGEKMSPRRGGASLARSMFPEHAPERLRRLGGALRRASSRPRSTSGCRRRSRCTSATSTSSASARCSSRHWFPSRDRARATATLIIATPFSQIISPKISGAMLGLTFLGLKGWQWMFIYWGLPAVVLGLLVLFFLPDRPRDARWLTPDERDALESELDRDRLVRSSKGKIGVLEALGHPKVLLLALAYFLAVSANYGLEFFLPSILKDWYKLPLDSITWILMIPPAAALVGQLFAGWHSDLRKERRLHTVVPLLIGATMLLLASRSAGNLAITVTCFVIAAAGIKSYQPSFWALPPLLLSEAAAAGSIGFINAVGNLGGAFGSSMMGRVKSATGSFAGGLTVLSAAMALSAVTIFWLGLGKAARPVAETG
jgi:predicted MFS family arabinose efflux permease